MGEQDQLKNNTHSFQCWKSLLVFICESTEFLTRACSYRVILRLCLLSQVLIEATVSRERRGYIALDDIMVLNYPCCKCHFTQQLHKVLHASHIKWL